MDLERYFIGAQHSASKRSILNRVLWAGIPFNGPHKLKITAISPESVKVLIPYKRKNLNHLKGLHACVLATGAEYASGLVLLQHLNPKEFRLIMKSMEVEYHYQGKMDAFVNYELPRTEVESQIIEKLKSENKVAFTCQIKVHDKEGNHLCTSHVHWQIKRWSAVTSST